jgi:hypothetical protein
MKAAAAVLAVALALLAAPVARAQPVSSSSGPGPKTYLELDLGAFLPTASDIKNLDPNVALSGTFGAMFTPNLGAEATLGYYRAAVSEAGSDRSLNVVPVLVNLRLVAPFKALELSARGGVGIHFASIHVTGAGSGSLYDSATAFGFQVGGSAAFNLSPTMLVGMDVLATFASAKFAGVDTSIDGLIISAKLGYRY